MPEIFPSQIVDFIDQGFSFVAMEIKGKKGSFKAGFPLWGKIETLVWMVEELPQHLLIGENYVEFLLAMGELRVGIKSWESGDKDYKIKKRNDLDQFQPITVIHNYLASCPDEGTLPETNELQFISDPDFRETLRIDISAANQALANGGWKAATVLAGSVIEALLLWALQKEKNSDPQKFKKAKSEFKAEKKGSSKRPPSDLNQWNLEEYIGVSFKLNLIFEDAQKSCDLTRGFRNFIHPGRAERKKMICDRGTAYLALGAVERVITDFEKRYKALTASP